MIGLFGRQRRGHDQTLQIVRTIGRPVATRQKVQPVAVYRGGEQRFRTHHTPRPTGPGRLQAAWTAAVRSGRPLRHLEKNRISITYLTERLRLSRDVNKALNTWLTLQAPRLTVSVETWPIAGHFTISRGAKTEAKVVVAELSQDGLRGRGECVPYARYGESPDGVAATLEQCRPQAWRTG